MSIVRSNLPDFSRETARQTEAAKPLFDRYVVPSYGRSLTLVRGQGVYAWDEDGNRYLDFGGGVAVNALGHCHPRMIEALRKQAEEMIHVSNLYYHPRQGELARRIVGLTGSGKVFFCNSGAEANEALIKLARRNGSANGGRFEIITALNSFHGRTMAGISATGQQKVKDTFGPLLPGFIHVPYNDLEAVEKAITPQTAAVLIEGIQGEGGVNAATPEYLLGLRALTRKHGILLLWDGVQCGCYRTGQFHSFQTLLEEIPQGADFLPDGIAMAKSLGGGFPIGATWMAEPWQDLFQPGSHGSTFGGGPLACAVSLAVLDEIEERKLDQNIRERGEQLLTAIRKLAGTRGITGARGVGGLIGMTVEGDASGACAKLRDAGLLTVPAANNAVRFLPPLNTTASEIDEAVAIVEKAL